MILDGGIFQLQRRAADFGGYEATILGIDINAPANSLRILSNGNVGIGTTDPPTQKLHVAGNIRQAVICSGANQKLYTTADGTLTCGTDQTGTGVPGAPTNASYVVMQLHGSLTAERRLTDGNGISIIDDVANNNVTVKFACSEVAGVGLYCYQDRIDLQYPIKSCPAGQAIRSFNLDSSANPVCEPVGRGTIVRCRVCLRVCTDDGGNICGEACSGWSDSPSWSPPAVNPTGDVNSVRVYIECQ